MTAPMVTISIILVIVTFLCFIFALLYMIRYAKTKNLRYVVFFAILIIIAFGTGTVGRFYASPLLWSLRPTPISNSVASEAQPWLPALPSGSKVTPINRPDVVAGQTISTGYEVGKSIIYPGYAGYSILANPALNWTIQSKSAYVKSSEAQKDLRAFLESPYANSVESQQAEYSLITLQTDNSGAAPGPNTSLPLAPTKIGSYQFDSGSYFVVSTNHQGGFLGDSSTLGTELGNAFGTKLAYPYRYASWMPYTTVYDILDSTSNVQLSLSWRFSGLGLEVRYPPGVDVHGSTYTWSSGPQFTWYFTFEGNKQFISSFSWLPTQVGTTYSYWGGVTVSNGDGGLTGGYGGGNQYSLAPNGISTGKFTY